MWNCQLNAESTLLHFQVLADFYYSPASHKESLLPLNTDLGAENRDVNTSPLLYVSVEADGIFLCETVALYKMALMFTNCFTDEI